MIMYHTIIQDIPQQHVFLVRDLLFQGGEVRADVKIPRKTVVVQSGDDQLFACVMPRAERKEAAA